MHVVLFSHTWGLVGGTERHAGAVADGLLERGHRVTALCAEARGEALSDVRVVEAPELGRRSSPPAEVEALAGRLDELAPDVVLVISYFPNLDALSMLVERFCLVRYVHDHVPFCPGLNKYREDGETCRDPMGLVCLRRYWLEGGCVCFKRAGHANPLLDPVRELLAKRREVRLNRRAARVLTNSRYMRAELLKVGFPAERTSVLYPYTKANTDEEPPGPLPEATEAFLASSDAPLLFTPARLTLPDKGVDYLLTALARVRNDFRSVVCGDGPAGDWLREKARHDGVAERVHFSGWLGAGEIETLYRRATLVVCPSVWDEPFGIVGIESMAHGRPVVAFRVGGIPEWCRHEETGLVLERKDVDGMAAAIDRLLDDEGLRRRLGERAREVLEETFGRERHMRELEECLESARAERADRAAARAS